MAVHEAIVLAAGYGKGLQPLTHTKHKVLMPILGNTLIDHVITSLYSIGVEKVVLVVSYLKDQVMNYLRSKDYGVELEIVDEGKPLGTAHALLKGYERISSDEFLVIYGDIFTEANDLKGLASVEGNVLGVYEVSDDPRRYGVVLSDEDGNIVRIIEKPREYVSRLVNTGIYKLSSSFIKFVEGVELSSRGEYELTDAINKAVKEGLRVRMFRLSYWVDIGRPWKLLEVNKYLLTRLGKGVVKGRVESNVTMKGPVVIEEGSEVLSGSYIVGPAYIGRNASIGPNAYIRPYSVILSNSRVGFNVEVKESIIMENVHISHQSYVGDSIVGEGSNLGAGTLLANLKFDGSSVKVYIKGVREDSGRRKLGAIIGGYVKTGVNVSVCPGVKIGPYSWIYPGVTVCEDVPPCTIVKFNGVKSRLRGCSVSA